MDKKLRATLKKPFGRIHTLKEASDILRKHENVLISIGDRSSCNLISMDIKANIIVFDNKCKRTQTDVETKRVISKFCEGKKKTKVVNAASRITVPLLDAMKKAIENKEGIIEVDGEEDLAALVACAYATMGSTVVYGQPDRGIVIVDVDARVRRKARTLLKKVRDYS